MSLNCKSMIFALNKIFVIESSLKFKGPLILGTFVYMFFSNRTFYSNKNVITLLKAVLSTFIILALMILYRNAISALSLYLISKN